MHNALSFFFMAVSYNIVFVLKNTFSNRIAGLQILQDLKRVIFQVSIFGHIFLIAPPPKKMEAQFHP